MTFRLSRKRGSPGHTSLPPRPYKSGEASLRSIPTANHRLSKTWPHEAAHLNYGNSRRRQMLSAGW